MDIVSPEKRSEMMSHIRSKDTTPEINLRKYLFKQGFRFRLHVKNLPGHPDIVLPKYRSVIFVHGCFWHQHEGCRIAKMPKTRTEFWEEKFKRNVERDKENVKALQNAGWRVLVVWECEISSKKSTKFNDISNWIKSDARTLL